MDMKPADIPNSSMLPYCYSGLISCLSVNFHSNNEKVGSCYLSSIFLIVQFQCLWITISEFFICTSVVNNLLKRVQCLYTVPFAFGLIYSAAAAKPLQLCPTLCNPIDSSPPGSPIPGILQARTLGWVAISFSYILYLFPNLLRLPPFLYCLQWDCTSVRYFCCILHALLGFIKHPKWLFNICIS